jgi:hypothetical protein
MPTRIRLHIDCHAPFAAGASFGEVGPYERLAGRVWFAVDPTAPAYRGVVDLLHAPRNPAGYVEYAADFSLLKPVDLARGNQRLLYDVINRGNKRALQFFNDAPHSNTPHSLAHAGNGFLLRRGYAILWSAWQGDLLPGDDRMTMTLPTASTSDGPITGVVRSEFLVEVPGIVSLPLSGNFYTRSDESVTLDTTTATLSRRQYEGDARQVLPATAWQFARVTNAGEVIPSTHHCYVPEGFRPGWIYELLYTAHNPLVLGLGFTGVRDLVSFLRHAEHDDDGTPNPLLHGITRAYAWGRSQSGRFLREFVYRGWNQDAQGRRVFDGIRTPHVSVPLATFTGWNLRSEGHGPKAMASIIGSYFPLALTAAQRHSTGDPRPALAERYRSQFDYIAQIARAAQALVEARLLLAEDADRYVEWAVAEKIWQ